ncbi:MAG: WD40/YVTN/BNR-like repeat-containing protein [Rhodothermales bacterium]
MFSHSRSYNLAVLLVVVGILAGCVSEPAEETWTLAPALTAQESGSDALFIGISPVDEHVVWISGTQGTFGRTVDGGATWQTGIVPGADSLQFRDVHAVDAETAYLLSIGNGGQSRIYKTTDAGQTWTLQFTNPEPDGFFDCMDFWDADHGMAFSDSFEGAFFLITTEDGGATWTRVPVESLPPAQPGEGSFAASGTCLVAQGDSTAWIGTGAGPAARVLKTTDRGRTWSVAETPIIGGASSGIASLAFRDERHGAALGGDIARPDAYTDNVAVTEDGGATWTLAGRPHLSGAVYGASYVPGAPSPTFVAVGPKGVDYSTDNGTTWAGLDTLSHWSVAFVGPDAGWAIGPEGRITKIALFQASGATPGAEE